MTALVFPFAIWTAALAGCSGAANPHANTAIAAQEATLMDGSPPTRENAPPQQTAAEDGCVANLPFSRGSSFCCLDEYLAHLEQQGAIDLPWWRQIGRGLYERVVRMPGAERETATREELMDRFGFSC